MTGPRDPYDDLPPDLDPRGGRRPGPHQRGWQDVPGSARSDPQQDYRLRPSQRGDRPPPAPGGGGRARRRIALASKIVAVMVSVAILCGSAVMWGFYKKFTVDVTRINAIPADQPVARSGDGQNILIVGNDNRAGLTAAQLKQVGTTSNTGVNTDTLMLLHLPPNRARATVISIPRDSYVTIPGFKRDKVNTAFADGACIAPDGTNLDCGKPLSQQQHDRGAQELVRTIGTLTGQHIDGYVEVSLFGFYTISDAIGGVNICLKDRWYDPQYEKGIDYPPGPLTLKGTLALEFVRERHGLPHGDLDRIRRQQAFISAILRKVTSAGTLLDPFKLNDLVGAVAKSLTFDNNLDPLKLVDSARNLAAGNVVFETIPTSSSAFQDGKSVLGVDTGQVHRFIAAAFAERAAPSTSSTHPGSTPKPSTPPTVSRGQVSVVVENGAHVNKLAGTTAEGLVGMGFRVAGAVDAANHNYTASQIHYKPGDEAAAHTLAAVVPGATLSADGTSPSLHLILGSSFRGLKTTPAASSPSSVASSAGSAASPSGSTSGAHAASDTGCVY